MTNPRQVSFYREFIRQAKELHKKYRRVQDDIDEFVVQLEGGATPGDRLQGMGDYIAYKARIASRDMQRGKSGGFRVIYYVRTEVRIILMTIYPKTERENISHGEVLEIIETALEELEDEIDSAADTASTDPDTPPAE